MNRICMLAAALSLAGCASRADFRPADTAGRTAAGMRAAYYEISNNQGNWGDAKVWSEGAYRTKDDRKVPVIGVGIRIRNDSQDPLEIVPERTNVEIRTEDGRILVLDRPLEASGSMTIAAKGVDRISFLFPLPDKVSPDDLAAFEFNWAVKAGEEVVYTQSTPFMREYADEYASYWSPYPTFGIGYGFGTYW